MIKIYSNIYDGFYGINGYCHRMDGPAVKFPSGCTYFYLCGMPLLPSFGEENYFNNWPLRVKFVFERNNESD